MPELTKAERELLLKKHERALRLRAEYNKQISNPYRQATGEGGTLFDAGLQRFQAMRINHFEHFKPTPKSFGTGFLCIVLPMVLYGWAIKTERDGREHKYRTGQVAYKDRKFKFI